MTARRPSPGAFLGESANQDGEDIRLDFGHHLNGAFGGTFGGAVAAGCVLAARRAAARLVPASLDVRFMRGLTSPARLWTTVLHRGRSLATVSVDVTDENGSPCARATVGLIAPASLEPIDNPGGATPPPACDYADGSDWSAPKGVEIPILATLRPRVLGSGAWGVATGITTPWTGTDNSAEAVCLAADICVGPPVAAICAGRWIPHPNPDLSLRFVGVAERGDLVAVGRAERTKAGLAAVSVQVFVAGTLVGIGVSTSMLLATGANKPR